MQITGTIQGVSPVQSGTSSTGNTWKKCEVVITEDREYGDSVCVTAFGDKCDIASALQKGMKGTIHFNIRTRTYNGKVFNDINFWRWEGAVAQQPVASVSPAPQPAVVAPQPKVDDGLPF